MIEQTIVKPLRTPKGAINGREEFELTFRDENEREGFIMSTKKQNPDAKIWQDENNTPVIDLYDGFLKDFNKRYASGFLKDFIRPQVNIFGGGNGKAIVFDPQINDEIKLQISLRYNDSFAGIYFKSHEPIDLSEKKYLCFNVKGSPVGNKIEIKLGYPEKAYYLEKYGTEFEEISIPLDRYNLDSNKVEILTIAMNDSHFINKSNNIYDVQELFIKNIHFK